MNSEFWMKTPQNGHFNAKIAEHCLPVPSFSERGKRENGRKKIEEGK